MILIEHEWKRYSTHPRSWAWWQPQTTSHPNCTVVCIHRRGRSDIMLFVMTCGTCVAWCQGLWHRQSLEVRIKVMQAMYGRYIKKYTLNTIFERKWYHARSIWTMMLEKKHLHTLSVSAWFLDVQVICLVSSGTCWMKAPFTISFLVLDIGNLKRDLRHHDLRVSLLAHEGDPGVVLENYDVLLYDEWNVMFFGCGKIM